MGCVQERRCCEVQGRFGGPYGEYTVAPCDGANVNNQAGLRFGTNTDNWYRSKTKINDDKQNERQKSLAGRVQEGYFSCMQRLIMVVGQGKQLLDMTSSIL